MPTDTLEQAITKAVESTGDPSGETTTQKGGEESGQKVNPPNPPNSPVPNTEVTNPNGDGEEDDPDNLEDEEGANLESDELNEEETVKAKQLFKALKDPAQQSAIIDFLATKAGYQKVENKQEATAAKKDIKAILKENLGEEFDFLTEKLGPAIDRIINDKLTESTADIRQKQAQADELRYRNEADLVINSISKTYYGGKEIPEEISSEMNKLMDRVTPSVDMTTREYLENIYFIASARISKNNNRSTVNTGERVNSNRNNAPSRLAATTKAAPVDTTNNGKMSLNDSIQKAIEAANQLTQ